MIPYLKITIAVIAILSSTLQLRAQDPHFTQFFSNPLYLNPAFAGSAGCSRITSSTRDQWPGISGTYFSSNISYDQYIYKRRSGLGINVMFENAAKTIYTSTADAYYSFYFPCRQDFLVNIAMNAGFGSKHLEWEKLTFPDQISSQNGFVFNTSQPAPEHPTKYYFNLGMGALFAYKKLIIGLSGDHLNYPDIGFFAKSRLHPKITFHGSYEFNIKDIASITPALLYHWQGSFYEILPTVFINIRYLKFGLGTRFSFKNIDCIYGIVGIQNNWMSFGYSYDCTLSKLTSATGGSHELSMMFKFNCKNKIDKFPVPEINGF